MMGLASHCPFLYLVCAGTLLLLLPPTGLSLRLAALHTRLSAHVQRPFEQRTAVEVGAGRREVQRIATPDNFSWFLPNISDRACVYKHMKPKDPRHPNCNVSAGLEGKRPRFALVLVGLVTPRNGLASPNSSPKQKLSAFIDVHMVQRHFMRYLVQPSGGDVDVFLHTAAPSLELRAKLLEVWKLTAYEFTGPYEEDWGPRVKALVAANGHTSSVTASRWLTTAIGLNLTFAEERKRGQAYSTVYVTRPDVLLWTEVDLRRYCDRTLYHTSCNPPFHTSDCKADFHYAMSGAVARKFAGQILTHLNQSRPQRCFTNQELQRFGRKVLNVSVRPDHVVVMRHEEVARKTQNLGMEAAFYHCHPNGGIAARLP